MWLIIVIVAAGIAFALGYLSGFFDAFPCLTADDFSEGQEFILLRIESLDYLFGYKKIAVIQKVECKLRGVFIVQGQDFDLCEDGDVLTVVYWNKKTGNAKRFTKYPKGYMMPKEKLQAAC